MEKIFQLIAEVGLPIAGALAMGAFIFIIIKQLMAGVVGQVKTLTGFCKSLQTRGRVMSNEIRKQAPKKFYSYYSLLSGGTAFS